MAELRSPAFPTGTAEQREDGRAHGTALTPCGVSRSECCPNTGAEREYPCAPHGWRRGSRCTAETWGSRGDHVGTIRGPRLPPAPTCTGLRRGRAMHVMTCRLERNVASRMAASVRPAQLSAPVPGGATSQMTSEVAEPPSALRRRRLWTALGPAVRPWASLYQSTRQTPQCPSARDFQV